jgi:FAD/FMN-containing dehydrogenase
MGELRRIGPPAMDLVQPMPYTAFQAMLDDFAPSGWQNYHRGVHLAGLPDEAIDAYLAHGPQRLSPMTQAIIFRHGGAVTRFSPETAAAGHRDAAYMAHPIAAWQDPAEDATHIAWTQAYVDALMPFATGGVYLNFEQDEGAEHVRRGYDAETYAKLVALKDKWDPTNVFRVNQNIQPSTAVEVPGQREKGGVPQPSS